MKKPITKKQIRGEIDQQIAEFLERGGNVNEIQRGISGRDNPDGALKPNSTAFHEPKTERTYVPEVIAALDERRNKKPEPPQKNRPRRQRKEIIYDDFGEPLRWKWVED